MTIASAPEEDGPEAYACPWCGRIHETIAQNRKHMAREKGRMEREARERLDQGHEPLVILLDWIAQRRPIRLPRTRLPGEGCVFRWAQRDGVIRYGFKFVHRGAVVLRRLGSDGSKWFRYSEAEAELHRAMAGDESWIMPGGQVRQYAHLRSTERRSAEAVRAFRSGGVRAAREACGYSLNEVSRRSGLDRSLLRRIEQGKDKPGRDTLVRIADALGLVELTMADISAAWPVAE